MSSKSNYLEWQVLQATLVGNTDVYPSILQTYVGLFTAASDPEAGTFSEVAGAGTLYARQSSSFGTQTPTGTMASTPAITYPQAGQDWGTAIAFGLFDAAPTGSGNLLYWGYLGSAPVNFASSGSDDLMVAPAHGMTNNDDFRIEATPGGSLPSGIVAGTTYYIVSGTVDTFRVAASQAGVPIDIGAGSGVAVSLTSRTIQADDTAEFADGAITVKEA